MINSKVNPFLMRGAARRPVASHLLIFFGEFPVVAIYGGDTTLNVSLSTLTYIFLLECHIV